ncbi:MAG: RagB/SusD family nutrient uptake outer membrane protein [Arachidicoccus sp.]|nr:RagB/SusD family nutrient uptake outer membrane protein [Arachidicoccus sp.]
MKTLFSWIGIFAILSTVLVSCTKDLNRTPINTTIATDVYSTPSGIKQALAKVYGAFALTGSSGSGSSDLANVNAGFSDFFRMYWNAQELPTDESICAWGDAGIPDLNYMTWSSGNIFLNGLYNRCIYQITVANSFLSQTANSSVVSADTLAAYRAEARFLRAYQYWVLMDLFGNPPFTDENSPIGSTPPQQIKRTDLYNYVVSELLAIQSDLMEPHTNEYGRADQAADWSLLARIYLNSNIYTGTAKYDSAIIYSSKVIAAGYSLMPKYNQLFLADNNLNDPEMIFPIEYDGTYSQNFGGTTFLVNSTVAAGQTGGTAQFGIPGGGWGGNRARSPLPQLFGADYTASKDTRAALMTGSVYTISSAADFTQGIQTIKFRNLNADGTTPPNASTFCSGDIPLFRLAEQYLIYAEAVLRGGSGGDAATALSYINLIRTRAYGNSSGNITSIQLTLPFILDERARELYIEGFRRTDLIRFGEFTTNTYLWPWKGGTANGKSVSDNLNIYPIPATDITVNTNLIQNPGYTN